VCEKASKLAENAEKCKKIDFEAIKKALLVFFFAKFFVDNVESDIDKSQQFCFDFT
jgi:hypothetical protein